MPGWLLLCCAARMRGARLATTQPNSVRGELFAPGSSELNCGVGLAALESALRTLLMMLPAMVVDE